MQRGESVEQIVARWKPGIAEFAKTRAEFLLY
jgi:hypothetical protein